MIQIQVTNTDKESLITAASSVNINILSSLQGKVCFIDMRWGGRENKDNLTLRLCLPCYCLVFFSPCCTVKVNQLFSAEGHQMGLQIAERKLMWTQSTFCEIYYCDCGSWRSGFPVCCGAWCAGGLHECLLGSIEGVIPQVVQLTQVVHDWARLVFFLFLHVYITIDREESKQQKKNQITKI